MGLFHKLLLRYMIEITGILHPMNVSDHNRISNNNNDTIIMTGTGGNVW